MLTITIPDTELFDHADKRFFKVKGQTIELEHSLVSISKWESKWKKPYINTDNKNPDEFRDYIRCMTLTSNIDPMVYLALSKHNIRDIEEYINDSMTATKIKETKGRRNRQVITNELIYYWMSLLNIPMECQYWHLNRLFTLIKVADAKQNRKKLSKKEAAQQQRELNAQRRAKYNTKG